MKFECEECGEVQSCVIDGYSVGDRLLEGVEFHVEIKDGKLKVSTPMPHDIEYMKDLNEKRWHKAIIEAVMDEADDCKCPKCGEYIEIDSGVERKAVAPPKKIEVKRAQDILHDFGIRGIDPDG